MGDLSGHLPLLPVPSRWWFVAYDYYLGTLYRRGYEYIWIILASILEPFIYHPIITFCSLKGYLNHLMSREYKWGKMTRKGFSQRDGGVAVEGAQGPPPAGRDHSNHT